MFGLSEPVQLFTLVIHSHIVILKLFEMEEFTPSILFLAMTISDSVSDSFEST